MAQEARLMMGPRDGEIISIVEPKPEIEVILAPTGSKRAQANKPEDSPDYDVAIYVLSRHLAPGVFEYTYTGMKPERKQPHEDSQD